jgi:hypothetical protein
MSRLLKFLGLVLALTLLMYGVWYLSARLLPEGLLRPFFVGRFSNVVGEFTFWKVFLANLAVGFLGVQFMNLFRVGSHAGGLYVLPVFWLIYGLLLGTNSFVFAGAPVPLSLDVLWTRTGFSELIAYTLGYEASRGWAVWAQASMWSAPRLIANRRRPIAEDFAYWIAGLLLLIVAVAREVGR